MSRFRAVLLSTSAAVVLTAATSGLLASAHTTPGIVNASHCLAAHGGQTTVEAGSTVVIRAAWATQLLADQLTFQDAQLSLASWNDGPMVDVSDAWGAPERVNGVWLRAIEVSTDTTLAAPGDEMRFTFALVLKRALVEQFNPAAGGDTGPIKYEAGIVFGGTCTVIAE